jgi:uncharacterized protein YndB with AHSA1/START domain
MQFGTLCSFAFLYMLDIHECVTCHAQGEFTELEPGKHIAMRWRFSTWEDACFSTVGHPLGQLGSSKP